MMSPCYGPEWLHCIIESNNSIIATLGTPNLWIRRAVFNCYRFKRFTDSQLFPRGFKYVCPKAYEEVERDGKRGNFLAVIGRSELDQLLLSSVKKHYENGKS